MGESPGVSGGVLHDTDGIVGGPQRPAGGGSHALAERVVVLARENLAAVAQI